MKIWLILLLISFIITLFISGCGYGIYRIRKKRKIRQQLERELMRKHQEQVSQMKKIANNYYSILQDYDNFVKNRKRFWTLQLKFHTKYLPDKKKLVKDLFRFRQVHSRIDTDTYGHLDDAKKTAYEIWKDNLKLKQQFGTNKTLTSIQGNVNKEMENTRDEFAEIAKKMEKEKKEDGKLVFPDKEDRKKRPESHLINRLDDDAYFIKSHAKIKKKTKPNKYEHDKIQQKYNELETTYLDLKMTQFNILRKIKHCIEEHPPLNSLSALENAKKYYFSDDPTPNILHVQQLSDNIFRIHFYYDNREPTYKDFIFQLDPLKCRWFISNVIRPQKVDEEDSIPKPLIRI